MPTWILDLIENITPLTTVAEGIAKIGEAALTEVKGSDNIETKAASLIGDLAAASQQISAALTANTPAAPAA
jgi:hypothetical protein